MNLIELSSIDSTNSEAKRIIASGKASSSIIFAHAQTAGRGRYGREWKSGKGNLYMSILLPLECELSKAAELSFVIGLATYKIVSSLVKNVQIKLKWPNDIFINNDKVGGILLESITHADQTWIILGLGLNLAYAPIEHSSSLKKHGIDISPQNMIDLILPSFAKYHNMWKLTGFTNIRKLWLNHAYKLDEQVNIGDMNTRITGLFESIDETGAMIIKLESGEMRKMSVGEMFF